jgi:uncharacterized membrane protein YdjX (TVP38/TMEM64 family)
MPNTKRRLRDTGLTMLLLAALGLLIWWLAEPVGVLMAAAADVRDWVAGAGPLAPVAYVVFYAAQILVAPLPGNFLGVFAGYLFGFGPAIALTMIGLAVGISIALLIGRYLGRPTLEHFFSHTELVRWERKLRLRSPLMWFVLFLFPIPDLVVYAAGLGTTPLRWLLPAILAGRSVGILLAITAGNATALLPPQFVLLQWVLFIGLAALAYRFQRPIRYHLLVSLRRTRRATRILFRPALSAPAEAPPPQ